MWLQNMLNNKQLIRNMSVEQRIQYRKQKQKYLQVSSKNNPNTIIIIVEYPQNFKMTYKCVIALKNWSALGLLEYMKKYIKDATTICIPKNKTTVASNKNLGELYDTYHDREDGMLYLTVLTTDPF